MSLFLCRNRKVYGILLVLCVGISTVRVERWRVLLPCGLTAPDDHGQLWSTATRRNVDDDSTTHLTKVSSNDVSQMRYNRTMVLHVGPHKHGSTYLQCVLLNEVLERAMQEDGWEYLGQASRLCLPRKRKRPYIVHNEIDQIFTRREHKIYGTDPGLQPSFVDYLEMLTQEKPTFNAFIVAEHLMNLSPSLAKMLVDYLHQHGWAVKIVVAYRPQYEYLPSVYGQRAKPKHLNLRNFPWPDEPKGKLPAEYFDFIDRGTFSAEVKMELENGLHKAVLARTLWSLQDIQGLELIDMTNLTVPMEQGADPYLHHFLCEILSTKHACAAVAQHSQAKKRNEGWDLSHDLLAVEAYQRGYYNVNATKKCSRLEVIEAISRFQKKRNQTSADFAVLNCLDQSRLDTLWAITLHSDRNVFGYSTERQRILRKGFEKQIAKKKYCSANAKATLDLDQELREHLQNLSCKWE